MPEPRSAAGGLAVLPAHAKLTTSLRLTGRREDGYHLLDAEMVSLSLADEIEIDVAGCGFEVRDEVDWTGLPGAHDADAADREPGTDLVERALRACDLSAGCLVRKRIPTGAGLGGGSADAAAILRFAGVRDGAVAVGLGADVPFCLSGGRARVRGIGEVVEPLTRPGGEQDEAFLLVTPRVHVSTAVVYAAFDALEPRPSGALDGGNDLEAAALVAYPELRWWRDLMAAAVGERPRLAGSGGTWFVSGAPARLEVLAAGIKAEVLVGRESALVTVAVPVDGPG